MSTEYICYEQNCEVSLLERSGNLDLFIQDTDGDLAEIKSMTPEQVATMAIKMLKAAYYQDEESVQLAARTSRGEYQIGVTL